MLRLGTEQWPPGSVRTQDVVPLLVRQCSREAIAIFVGAATMTLTRFTMQFKAPWEDGPQPSYYWTNSFMADPRTPDEYDETEHQVIIFASRFLNDTTRTDWFKVVEVGTGHVVRDHSFSTAAGTERPIVGVGLVNTVLCWLLVDGHVRSYKRIRPPLGAGDMVGDRLSDDTYTFYHDRCSATFTNPAYRFCANNGDLFDEVVVSPLVHGWQMRHGTRRAKKRYYQ